MFAQFSFLNHISKARCAPRPLGRGFGKRSCRQRFTISERHRECECRAFSRFGPQKLQFLMALENETFLTCSGSDRRPKRQKLSVSERLETRRVSQLRGLLSSRVVKDGASLRGAVSVGPRHETFFAQQKQTSKETLVSLRNFCTKLSKEASLFKH